jgi:predicted component of type VI protein secretion system
MAKRTGNDDLFQRLRAQGLRKRTAKLISDATDRRRKPARGAERALADLKRLINDVEDRISGGPAKRKAAAKKAANTRRRNARRRSEAAKKAARTRAKSR